MSISPAQLTGKDESHLSDLSSGQHLHSAVLLQYKELQHAASKAGFDMAIASGYRSFERQLMIWNAKYTGINPVLDKEQKPIKMDELDSWGKVQAILNYSALPGASRHHWGTDLDFYDKAAMPPHYQLQLIPQEYQARGPFSELTIWLHTHSREYGFYFPYQNGQSGVAPEPWHLSYYPLADCFLELLEAEPKILFDTLVAEDIEGKNAILHNFEYILDNYVLNVAKSGVNE